MGETVFNFPAIEGTVAVDWNDVNLRLSDVAWSILAITTVRVRIYRVNISPDPITDMIIEGPASDAEPVPGNLRMTAYTDPEYPEEGERLLWPEGLVFNVNVIE